MGAFGERLKREREMRGVTLTEISESTKISTRALEALENEDFDVLPGGIFNRGFVRSYARYLGIDEEQAVADYLAISQEAPAPEDKFPIEIHQKPRQGAPPLNPKRSFLPVLLAILALVLVVGGWTYWIKRKPQLAPAAGPSTTHTPAPSTANSPAAQPQQPAPTQAVPATQPSSTQPASSRPATDKTQAPSDTTELVNKAVADDSSMPPADSDSRQKTFTVAIKAVEDAWVSVTTDSNTPIEQTLSANHRRLFKADKKVVLRTGNARGLEVSYNGGPFLPLGDKENEVRTVTFNARGRRE